MKKNATVLVGVCASIALYKSCELVRRLQDRGINVVVVMTPEAGRLINPLVFQSLSGNRVYHDMFEAGQEWDIKHISLAEQADAIVIAPATANIIAKIAHGICDDLLTCVVCATRAPVTVCPAMNETMLRNKITTRNIKLLQEHGFSFVLPRAGKLACGKTGTGCLADVDAIVDAVVRKL
jgi:phosphopantothenoylcysteine synthetase/decarboxylase